MKKATFLGIVLVLSVLFLVPSVGLAAPPVKVNYVELVVVDGTGAVLGTFLSYQHMPPSNFPPPIYSELMYMNTNGYVIALLDIFPDLMLIHQINNLYYLTTDCTGDLYAQAYRLAGTVWSYVRNDGSMPLGYIPPNAGTIDVNFNSSSSNGICSQVSGTITGYQVLLNDPLVTGISDTQLTVLKPIRIERRNR